MPFSSIAANRRPALEGLAPLRVVELSLARDRVLADSSKWNFATGPSCVSFAPLASTDEKYRELPRTSCSLGALQKSETTSRPALPRVRVSDDALDSARPETDRRAFYELLERPSFPRDFRSPFR